jgi:PKD repeat protein
MTKDKRIIVIMAIAWILLVPTFSLIPNIAAQTPPTLSLSPAKVEVTNPSNTFTLDFKISGVTDLWGWGVTITWDSQYVSMTKAPTEGDFFSKSDHASVYQVGKVNDTLATYSRIVGDTGLDANGVNGDGTLVTFTFQVLKPVASTTITVNATNLLSSQTTGPVSLPQYLSINPYPTSSYASATISYIPEGGAPVADAGSDQTVNQFANVILNASKTIPQDVADQTYTWTFFDNASRTLTGMITNYTFFWPGTTPVTLTVTNSQGSTTAVVDITVNDTTPPVAIITTDNYPDQVYPVNEYIHFSSNQSYDPYNLTLVNLAWNFGDNQKSDGSHVSNRYSTAGTYLVTLTVSNSEGLNATTTKTIVVGHATSTPNPAATDSPSDSSTNTPQPQTSPTPQDMQAQLNTSFNLPPTILYPLIFATVFALGGAAFWLRKENEKP